jgi:serine/tyrosine/threonine adenylyltransferase
MFLSPSPYLSLPGLSSPLNGSHQLPQYAWAYTDPTPTAKPEWVITSTQLSLELDLDDWLKTSESLLLLSGQLTPKSSIPYAPYSMNYSGHQFGNWAGQLGDGRAINLGQINNTQTNTQQELQLKGAGPTPFSRRADGRAVLRSSVREFLCSEAMYHLGVPTTRALSLCLTGDEVLRDKFYDGNPEYEPGAIVARVSPSFIRFGHIEGLASNGQFETLHQLLDQVIQLSGQRSIEAWFEWLISASAKLAIEWLRVGFVHAVLNTDNTSVLGLTIDYGPFGMVETFDPNYTPNTTDHPGRRYGFNQQGAVLFWNLERLTDALEAAGYNNLRPLLETYVPVYKTSLFEMYGGKFGISDFTEEDMPLLLEAYQKMHEGQLDFTQFFIDLELGFVADYPNFGDWYNRYKVRQNNPSSMEKHNPRFILRHHLLTQAIAGATMGDYTELETLYRLLQTPYIIQPGFEDYYQPPVEKSVAKFSCSS